jgi:hypothetical protein
MPFIKKRSNFLKNSIKNIKERYYFNRIFVKVDFWYEINQFSGKRSLKRSPENKKALQTNDLQGF